MLRVPRLVVPAERPLELKLRGGLRHLLYSKDVNAKNRDVIEYYLEEQGQFVTPKNMSKTQYVPLSYLQKNASSNVLRASRE